MFYGSVIVYRYIVEVVDILYIWYLIENKTTALDILIYVFQFGYFYFIDNPDILFYGNNSMNSI